MKSAERAAMPIAAGCAKETHRLIHRRARRGGLSFPSAAIILRRIKQNTLHVVFRRNPRERKESNPSRAEQAGRATPRARNRRCRQTTPLRARTEVSHQVLRARRVPRSIREPGRRLRRMPPHPLVTPICRRFFPGMAFFCPASGHSRHAEEALETWSSPCKPTIPPSARN